MKEIAEARKVNAFRIEGQKGLFRKVSRIEAEHHVDIAIQALLGSTISWFIPFDSEED